MLGGLFVASFHIKERQIRVNKLVVRPHLLGLVAFGNGRGVIPFSIVGHAKRELRIEMLRVLSKDRFILLDGRVVVRLAEFEHGVIVFFLKRWHNGQIGYGTGALQMQAGQGGRGGTLNQGIEEPGVRIAR